MTNADRLFNKLENKLENKLDKCIGKPMSYTQLLDLTDIARAAERAAIIEEIK